VEHSAVDKFASWNLTSSRLDRSSGYTITFYGTRLFSAGVVIDAYRVSIESLVFDNVRVINLCIYVRRPICLER